MKTNHLKRESRIFGKAIYGQANRDRAILLILIPL